jgi:hypothetical protein
MSTPIEPSDTPSQRITKLLPADITAALIAIKSGVPGTNLSENWVVYGAIVIGILSPLYFYFVLQTKNAFHITFLVASFVVFTIAIAAIEIRNMVPAYEELVQGLQLILTPIWTFIVTPIFGAMLGKQLISNATEA